MSCTMLPTHEVRLYVGSREGYDGPVFGKKRVLDAIREYQLLPENMACVRVTETDFQAGDYLEGGFEVALIDYPRFPKGPTWVNEWMLGLARHLLVSLKQNRIGVVKPDVTYLVEAGDAVANPAGVKDGIRLPESPVAA